MGLGSQGPSRCKLRQCVFVTRPSAFVPVHSAPKKSAYSTLLTSPPAVEDNTKGEGGGGGGFGWRQLATDPSPSDESKEKGHARSTSLDLNKMLLGEGGGGDGMCRGRGEGMVCGVGGGRR